MWSSIPDWRFGDRLTTRPDKKITVKKPQLKKPWMTVLPVNSFGNGKRKCKEIKIATWNMLSLYCYIALKLVRI